MTHLTRLQASAARIGRLLRRRDQGFWVAAVLLIITPCVLFSVFVLPYLTTNVSVGISVVFAMLWLLSLTSIAKTSFMDPGFLPINLNADEAVPISYPPHPPPGLEAIPAEPAQATTSPAAHGAASPKGSPAAHINPGLPVTYPPQTPTPAPSTPLGAPSMVSGVSGASSNTPLVQFAPGLGPVTVPGSTNPPNVSATAPQPGLPFGYPFMPTFQFPDTKPVIIRGKTYHIKYCSTCKIWRPPRSSHCSICDRCVEYHDHHCPWTGNCVGKRNYRTFYVFLFAVTALAIYVFTFSVVHVRKLVEESASQSFVVELGSHPVDLFLFIYCLIITMSVLFLFLFHTFLSCINMTTHERIKWDAQKWRREKAAQDARDAGLTPEPWRNPWDRGGPIANFVWTHFRGRPDGFEDFADAAAWRDPPSLQVHVHGAGPGADPHTNPSNSPIPLPDSETKDSTELVGLPRGPVTTSAGNLDHNDPSDPGPSTSTSNLMSSQ